MPKSKLPSWQEVKKWDRNNFENYAEGLQNISKEQRKQVVLYRRRLRNRDMAKASRDAKKREMELLTKEVERLKKLEQDYKFLKYKHKQLIKSLCFMLDEKAADHIISYAHLGMFPYGEKKPSANIRGK